MGYTVNKMTEDHGVIAENILESICRRMFGPAYVFRSPFVEEREGKTEELTDILVLVGNVLITIQSKSYQASVGDLDRKTFDRIIKRYETARGQLGRTLNAATRNERVCLISERDAEVLVPWSEIERRIGIVTINVDDALYGDPERRFQLPVRYEHFRGMEVHSFILRDLYTMLAEVTTVGDFIELLDERAWVLERVEPTLTNDLDILAVLKSNYGLVEQAHAKEPTHIVVEPGTWEEYRRVHSEKIQERDRKLLAPTVVDLLIQDFASSLEYTVEQYQENRDEAVRHWLRLLGALGRTRRMHRHRISQLFAKKLKTSAEHPFRYFFVPVDDYGLFFLISNEPDREARREMMLKLVCVLCESFAGNPKLGRVETVFGLCTEGAKLPGRSFDGIEVSVAEAVSLLDEKDDKVELFRFRDEGSFDEWTV